MYIGVVGYETDGVFGVHTSYMEFASSVGNPVILSPGESLPKGIDGVLLPGGADVIQSIRPGFKNGRSNPHLEYFDKVILPKILFRVPIFGICRGLQTINVACGGTLIQHLPLHPYSAHEFDFVHKVKSPNKPYKPHFEVNSFHHQAVSTLGNGLNVELVSTSDNIIEAISGNHLFAVQWHPERMHDEYSLKKFTDLFS